METTQQHKSPQVCDLTWTAQTAAVQALSQPACFWCKGFLPKANLTQPGSHMTCVTTRRARRTLPQPMNQQCPKKGRVPRRLLGLSRMPLQPMNQHQPGRRHNPALPVLRPSTSTLRTLAHQPPHRPSPPGLLESSQRPRGSARPRRPSLQSSSHEPGATPARKSPGSPKVWTCGVAATDAVLALHVGHEPNSMSSVQPRQLNVCTCMRTSGEHCTRCCSLDRSMSMQTPDLQSEPMLCMAEA